VRILLTGASGFVGTAALTALAQRGHPVRAAARRSLPHADTMLVTDIGPDTDWRVALAGCDAVVHLAARVHVMREGSADPLAAFRRVNTAGTLALAEQAAAAGVRALVFASTVKVLGESSARGRPFTDTDPPAPMDPYAISKAEAERGLADIATRTGMRVVALRPPLVYGPGVGANFLRLMRGIERGTPLPLGAIANRRSLVYVGNLADAIAFCVEREEARGAYLVSDGADLATPELVRRLAAALGRPARLLPVPAGLLRTAGALLGKRAEMERLLGDLAVAPNGLARLGWRAPFTVDEGLRATAAWFRQQRA
jgi:nucleoside-diphosphate-sugar epimerase